jgi:hypothetical protein
MNLNQLDLQEIVTDVLEQAGEVLSRTARDGYEEAGRGAVRMRFDFTPVEDSDKTRMDAKLLGYQAQADVSDAGLGEEVDELVNSYDPDTEGVALFTVSEGETGYFQFTLAPEDRVT